MPHDFTGEEAPARQSVTAPSDILKITPLADFQARHHPTAWEPVKVGGTDKKPVYEWLPIVRMHRIVGGVGGVWSDNKGRIDLKTVDKSRGVWKRKGWIYLDESVVGNYRRRIGPCLGGGQHYCWIWDSYSQLPGLEPELVRDQKREYAFRRGLIGRVVEGARIVLSDRVRQGRIREAEKALERILKLKETPLTVRERDQLETKIAAMKATPAPPPVDGGTDAQAA